ncbi:MAG: TIGR01777 family oxidoreductase [Thermodesulfobacteriota bacterium]
MEIFLAGGTGFIGQALARHLAAAGHQLTALVRHPDKARLLPAGTRIVAGTPLRAGPWVADLNRADAVVNLTGRSIFARWSEPVKAEIRASRLQSTRSLVQAIDPGRGARMVLVNASAVGYYGVAPAGVCREDSPPGDDFLARVCVEWEAAAREAAAKGVRVLLARFGVVLGRDGGALAAMRPAFRLGLGGRLGSGDQPFAWIHLSDLTAAIAFMLATPALAGPVNLVAPQEVTNRQLTVTLARLLGRPAALPVPAAILRLALGELGGLLLGGGRVRPGALIEHGFLFRFPELEGALADLVAGR